MCQSTVSEVKYSMWKYYLVSCAMSFKTRNIHVWHYVFTKNGIINTELDNIINERINTI